MVQLTYQDESFPCYQHETVLDALIRENIAIPYSCRQGVCGNCLIRSLDHSPPSSAQNGLKVTQQQLNYFFACLCRPEQDMTVALPNAPAHYIDAEVIDKYLLNDNTILLSIQCEEVLDFFPGQFVNLKRHDGLTRSYSITNRAHHPGHLEFHIRKLAGGEFSEWVLNDLSIGTTIQVSEPKGDCFYVPERCDQSILMVATGTGLAPLSGILKDALSHGHHGPIQLYHGSRNIDGLYHIDEMRQLAKEHPNFTYTPCLSGDRIPEGFTAGRVHEVAIQRLPDLALWRVFLCGHPEMVMQMQQQAFLNGASPNDIFVEAFHPSLQIP